MLVFLAGAQFARADEFDTLRTYWLNQLVGTNLSSSTLASRVNSANDYWSSMNTNADRTSLWNDLPIGSVSANISSTFNRLKTMALAWATPGCALHDNANLAAAVTGGLDWMAANAYTPATSEYNNWWDWEIGGPQAFNDAQVLMYPALTGAQLTNYNNSVDHFSPPTRSWMTGANLTDKVKVVLIRAILGKSSDKMSYGQSNLSPVFLYTTSGDGFYHDGSFIQHTRIAYTGSYGIVLLGDVAQLVNLLKDSTWQITDPNLGNVYAWVTNSFQPLIYHGAMMDMVRGRAISRYGSQETGNGAAVINDVRRIAQFAPPEIAAAFTNWAASPSEPPGQYQFAAMDRVVAWRTNFCLGLSMSSTRIANYESINGENLHGWFTGDGMTYLYLGNPDTQFQGDFWPTIDPYHLPGTTVDTKPRTDAYGAQKTTSQNWVGGAQVSQKYGVAGMSLASYGSTLVAKKSWFMFDNEVVCLGAGITCGGSYEIDTTVEDRRLGSSPTNNFTVDGTAHSPVIGWSSNLTGTTWCALDGVGGYYFPGGATNLQATFESRTHSWSEINNGTYLTTSTNLYTDNYLKLWFNHGIKPTNSTYAYVLLPNFTAADMSAYATSPDIEVISNTATVQAVSKSSLGLVAANFWTTGTHSADLITVNTKASVITSENSFGISVGVAEPTQTNKSSITVTLDRSAVAVASADPGVSVVQLSPQIILSVNVNGSLGKTYQASFVYPAVSLNWDADPGATGAQDGSGTWNAGANWWDGNANVSWNDSAPYIATFGAGGSAGTVTLGSSHQAFALVFNAVSSGSYSLEGNDDLSLENGITASTSATVNTPLNLLQNQTWTTVGAQTLNINRAVSAPSPVALSLAGAGTVNLGGTNQLSGNINSINFVDAANESTLNVAASQTVNAVSLHDGVAAAVAGNGTLSVTGAADMRIGGTTSATAQWLDLSGLNSFEFNAPSNTFSVGGQANTVAGYGTLYLAATNIITANVFGVQTVTGSTSSQSSGELYLGKRTTINADTLKVGLTRDNGTIQFASGLTNPVLVIRSTDGTGRANVTVGTRSSSYFSTATARFDLVTNVIGVANLDAKMGTLLIANETYCLNASDVLNGIFMMGNGILDATNITVGAKTSAASQSTGIVNGTFTQDGGLVKVTMLTLGDELDGNTGTLNVSYNLNGGTLDAGIIAPGANNATRILNWNNGVIGNYDAATDLAIADGLNVILGSTGSPVFYISSGRTGTVNSAIGGAGSIMANGKGTLVLAATNTYSGTTTIANGNLRVDGALGTNTVTVAAGATLGGIGKISGIVMVQTDGTIQPGNNAGAGVLTMGALNLGTTASSATTSRFSVSGGGEITATTLNVSGANTIDILDSSLAMGTNTLMTYTGTIGGSSGFGGLHLGTLPAGVMAHLLNTGSAVQLAVTSLVNTNAPVLANSIVGNLLTITWPADHLGWRLEVQTNEANTGLSTNWFTWPDSTNLTSVSIPASLNNAAVFFRLVYP